MPRIILPPPWRAGLVLQDGLVVSQSLHASLTTMLATMNKAIDTLADLSYKIPKA